MVVGCSINAHHKVRRACPWGLPHLGCNAGELVLVESVVDALTRQKLFVIARFHHSAVLHNNDDVGVTDGGKTVCDDQTGAVLHQRYHRLLDVHFGSGVNGGGCFVQNQNLRIRQYRTGNGQKLALTLTQIAAAFGENRFVAVRKP